MCGITGILHYGYTDNTKEIVSNMISALSHRGSDATGIYNDAMISLGHARLSIIDLQNRANQPFADKTERYVLSFNGEIYNYQELKQELSTWSFNTESDTEVLLAAFDRWGIDCLNKLDGIFAFAIWDSLEKTLWLARDRMGVKPFYYFEQDKTILFASEIRSLLSSGMISPSLDVCGLTHYLSFQNASSEFPIVTGVKELNSATYLKITDGGIKEHVYWKPNNHILNQSLSYGDFTRDIFKLLDKAVNKRMVGDVPVSAYLSGGVDSSAIVALMSLHSNVPINTFTLSFQESSHDESAYANIIAKRFETNHTNIILNEDQLLNEVVNGLNVMDSPSADGINTYILSTAIKSANIKVALSGIGADELFAGYPGFNYFKNLQHYSTLFNSTHFFRKGIAVLMNQLNGEKYSKISQLLQADNTELYSIYPALRQLFSSEKLKKILNDCSCIDDVNISLVNQLSTIQHAHHLSRFSLAEYNAYAKNTLLKDVDQMSMANGLEVREPFFDIDLIEYVLSIPDEYKKGKYNKQLLLDAISPLLPDEIIKRKKRGFVLPWEKWMRNELRSFCDAQIMECADRMFMNKSNFINYWKKFLKKESGIQWIELWQFVVLNYWMNKNSIEYKA
ncbi:MAG: asparagine synthase (glutamine-hydrolyzing) [Chitinophagaceae bacterium]|jgi:asparagine synthase (glutamine-hydrolysing)